MPFGFFNAMIIVCMHYNSYDIAMIYNSSFKIDWLIHDYSITEIFHSLRFVYDIYNLHQICLNTKLPMLNEYGEF